MAVDYGAALNRATRVDYEKLGELIDGYGGIAADDLEALPVVADARSDEIALLRDENARLRQALAEVELILTGLRGGIVGDESDVLGGWQA